jgi:hypothetical protein
VDGGQLVGVVDRADILASIAGSDPREAGPGRPDTADATRHREPPPRVEPINEPTQETAEFLVENLYDPGPER